MGITPFGLIAVVVAIAAGFLLGTAARARSSVTVALALLLAFYLMLVSMVATQIFDPKFVDLSDPRTRLDQGLGRYRDKEAPVSLQQFAAPSSIYFGEIEPILVAVKQFNPELAKYTEQLVDQLNVYETRLEQQPHNFVSRVKEESDYLLQQFDIENRDHFGVHQTDEHVDLLIGFLQNWISSWAAAAKTCRSAIIAEQGLVSDFIGKIRVSVNKDPQGNGDFPHWPDPILDSTLTNGCDFDAALSNSGVPQRKVVDEQLGVIGQMSEWLLKTESRDIALIVGLLGFGLFGAVSASFIRPSGAANALANTIFIRGIAAAVLIYLVVVGGLAVFTRQSIPNPYAVYFACFVAAVFSDDVWSWARQRQQRDFASRETREPDPTHAGKPAELLKVDQTDAPPAR